MLRGNHDHGGGVTSHHAREDGCINYKEIVSTVDLGVLIHHGSATEAAVVETNLGGTCIVNRLARVRHDVSVSGNLTHPVIGTTGPGSYRKLRRFISKAP